ncbi:DYW domain containing protein [Parasponia andersonii]|uniref:DYW domain containing protein n=1 Tax=Parasponia andersonii TaxID=3476 RepID=A0A2P5C545_PARAD|nr:DYW domain containing protein [Parasponia andersonii]
MATVVRPAITAGASAPPPLSSSSFISSLPHFPAKHRPRQNHNHVFFSNSPIQSLFSFKSFEFKRQSLLNSELFHGCTSSSSPPEYDIEGLFDKLRLWVRSGDVELAKAVHASILKLGEDTYLGNALIGAYLKLGLVTEAYKVFNGLSCPDMVSYTALVSGFSKSNREDEAVELFFRMRSSGIEPNEYGFVAILTACIRLLELELGFQVHGLAIKMGYLDCVFVSNALMGLYGKCGCLDFVLELFDRLPRRDLASWNTTISSAVKESLYGKAFELFREMQRNDDFRVDHFTFSTLLTACTGSNALAEGQEVHAHAIKCGLEDNLSVSNALIGFYTKCGSVKNVMVLFEKMPVTDTITWTEVITAYMDFGLTDLALEIFKKMPERNSIAYNALLTGFCKNGEGLRALSLFTGMVKVRLELTDFTLSSVVYACGLLRDYRISEQIHGFIVKSGCGSNACIESALLDMYTRCGRMSEATKMFNQWPVDRDSSIILTSLICGYARNGQPEEAISLFHRSQSEGTMVLDEVALTSVTGICGSLAFHEMGKQIHCIALKSGSLSDLEVGNAIVSMYSKCWNMEDAVEVFNSMAKRDVVSWNGLIAGHLLHRQGDKALAAWSEMEKTGIKPDKLTFNLVISAYRHTNSNLVDNCRSLFYSLKTRYDIEPTSDHFASFVGVLGYWGLLKEAEEMVCKLPFEPDVSVWRALLDCSRLHLNTAVGKRVAKRILAVEPKDPSTYVLVSNLYSASGRWHCSEMVREDMRQKGFKKQPAQSWIVHENKIHSFYARDKSHPQAKDIHSALELLILECLKAGYVPDTSFVLHEVEEHQKKNFLFYHSAKLAATYGILTTKPGKPVRIVKNILLCGDCHAFFKYASIVTGKDIFLRDTTGFHCFSRGQCSCKDYW